LEQVLPRRTAEHQTTAWWHASQWLSEKPCKKGAAVVHVSVSTRCRGHAYRQLRTRLV